VPLVFPQGLWAAGITLFALLAALMLIEVAALLIAGERRAVDALLGPRTLQDETKEALDALAMAVAKTAGPER
jgi:hypothetical protein